MEKFGVDAHLHAREAGVLGQGRAGDQHRPHPGRADRGDARQRDACPTSRPRATWRSSPGSAPTKGSTCPRSCACRWSRRWRPTTSRSALLNDADRRRGAAPGDEGCLGRVADGREDAGQQPARHVSMLHAATLPLESNVALALVHDAGRRERPQADRAGGRAPTSTCTAGPSSRRRRPAARPAMRPTRCSPRRRPSSGPSASRQRARALRVHDRALPCGRARHGIRRVARARASTSAASTRRASPALTADAPDARAEALIAGVEARGGRSVFLRWLEEPARPSDRSRGAGRDLGHAGLGPAVAQAHLARSRPRASRGGCSSSAR